MSWSVRATYLGHKDVSSTYWYLEASLCPAKSAGSKHAGYSVIDFNEAD